MVLQFKIQRKFACPVKLYLSPVKLTTSHSTIFLRRII